MEYTILLINGHYFEKATHISRTFMYGNVKSCRITVVGSESEQFEVGIALLTLSFLDKESTPETIEAP